MLQGRTYLCKKLDLGSKVAMVRPADLKYYTKTRDFTDVHVVGGHTAYPVRVSPERKEKKRKDYAFRRQFNEKPSIIPGCPGRVSPQLKHHK